MAFNPGDEQLNQVELRDLLTKLCLMKHREFKYTGPLLALQAYNMSVDNTYAPFGKTEKPLIKLKILDKNGKMPESYKEIIRNCFSGSGFGLKLRN